MSKYLISSEFPVTNAAGHCKDVDEVKRLARSAVGGIVVGSVTVKPREGNPGQTFYQEGPWALNAIGLRNRGLEYYKEVGPEMVIHAHNAGKPIIMSGAGFSSEEYAELARCAWNAGFDGYEINLGCPNVVDGGKRHRTASFDPFVTEGILEHVFRQDMNIYVTAKVSPMTDSEQISTLATVFGKFHIHAVVTMNAVPNGLLFNNNGKPVIQTPDKTGWAGFSGPAIKPLALGQVSQWREVLPSHIQVWGVGGVSTGKDVRDMLRAGASVVQVGTAYFSHSDGAKFFGDLANEFINLNEGVS